MMNTRKNLGIFIFAIMLIACKEKNQSGAVAENTNDTAGHAEYQIDPVNSTVKWIGYKPAGTHNGTVPVSKGMITVSEGNISGGTIEMDMTHLTVLDPAGDMGQNLEKHLKGQAAGKENDFFNVDKYPKAIYTITSASKLENDPDATHMINGNLTIKEITKPVSFKAKIEIKDNSLTASAAPFDVDRTEFDIRFKSKKFFDNLKDDFINDMFQIGFYIVANKK
jgi:polyisoprenoid-binding protein YceI